MSNMGSILEISPLLYELCTRLKDNIIFGVIKEQNVYSCEINPKDDGITISIRDLIAETQYTTYSLPIGIDWCYYSRWRIGYGHFWGIMAVICRSDLRIFSLE